MGNRERLGKANPRGKRQKKEELVMRKRRLYMISILVTAAMMMSMMSGCAEGDSASNGKDTVVSAAETDESSEADSDSTTGSDDTTSSEKTSGDETASSDDASGAASDDEFTDRDIDPSYDESEVIEITLDGSSASVSGNGAEVDGSIITISAEGVYVISGTLEDGQIIVNAADTEKVQIVLNGVDISCSDSACIYVKSADKTFITLADGTENTLSDTGEAYAADGDENVDGVIYSKDDVTFNGSGSLTINASYNHGIVGNDDVKFTGGSYYITATAKGIKANDSLRIKDGSFVIASGDDALHTSNNEEEGKGYIYIADGEFELSSGDDGIHAEKELVINDGVIVVTQSNEGIEGATIEVNGGDISVNAGDDGMNATGTSTTGSMDSAEWDFGEMKFGGGGMMDAVEDALLTINGGTIYVNASGDGLDSNGYLYINGGNVTVDGPVNDGNGALDTGYEGYVNGGTVIITGSSGMAESFSSGSEQYSILYNFTTALSEGTEVSLTDESGNAVMSYTLNKTASSVLISSADITDGTYTIKAGDIEDTITVSGISTSAGAAGGMGGFGGMGNHGGMGNQGEMGDPGSSGGNNSGFGGGFGGGPH